MHFTTKGLLANNINVKILAVNPTRNFVNIDLLPLGYIQDTGFECVTVDTAIKPLRLISNIFRSESYFTERFISAGFETALKRILQSESFDIVQIEHLYLCKYIATIKKYSGAKIVLRPQNIEYVIWQRYLKNVGNPLKKIILKIATGRLKKFEQSVVADLDGIIALTKEDAGLFNSFPGSTPAIIVPMGYDYDNIKGYDFDRQFSCDPVVYHLGSMDWMPNIEAVEWFLTKVAPKLVEQQFSGKIVIAGRKMPSWVFRHKSATIDVIDEVNAPIGFQESKQIMIVPLWSGSGIRAKIIEGLALGKIIISTSIGAQGIDCENGKNILIADTASEFASQIMRCANSKELRMAISANARKLSIAQYHNQTTTKNMIAFYNLLLGVD